MTKTASLYGCDDPTSIQADQALEKISAQIKSIEEIEIVPLRAALDRVVARDIVSPDNIPNHTNSAMDGYALIGSDVYGDGQHTLKLTGTSMAGAPFDGRVNRGECVRIMTGAVMPLGADTVVMQEQAEADGDHITIHPGQKAGANVRQAGEDLARGDVAIKQGMRMNASRLGVTASLGIAEIAVYRKPRVAFFSNGDELRSLGERLETGELYDSNRYTLFGLLTSCNVELIDMGVIADDRDAIELALRHAARISDVVITSAGASVGEADYIKPLLDEIGKVNFWKVAIKPGRPLAFGCIDNGLFFGLPGNPASVVVTFDIFVRPALTKLSGQAPDKPLQLKVPCASELRKRPGRSEFQRGILSCDQNGAYIVHSTGTQGSGILTSISVANCYIILPVDSTGAEIGDEVTVQPFANKLTI